MPVYSELLNADTVKITLRGDFNSMKREPEINFKTVENYLNNNKVTIKMESLFPRHFEYTIPLMQCGVPLKTHITYPRELWEKIINEGLYELPVYGQKDQDNTKIGRVSNMELKGDVLYATIDIDTSTSWGVYAKNELADNDKLFIKPYIFCHLNQYKEIDPVDFILKYFYLVDYAEDIPEESKTNIEISKEDVENETYRVYKEMKEEGAKETFNKVDNKAFESEDVLFTSKEMPTNKTLLDRFNAVSNTEELFKSVSSL